MKNVRSRARRHSLRAVTSVVATGLLLAACSSSGNSGGQNSGGTQPFTLRLAVPDTEVTPIPNDILFLGVDSGYFASHGIDLKLVKLNASTTVVDALLSGDADIGNVDTQDVVNLVATGKLDIKAINSTETSPDYVLAADDSVQSFADLKGKSVAVTMPGGQDDLMLKLIASHNGLGPQDIHVLSVGKPSLRALSLVQGRVSATVLPEAQWASLTAAQRKNLHLVLDEVQFDDAVPLESKVNVTSTKDITDKAEALQRFTEAVISLTRQYASDPDTWAKEVSTARPDLTLDSLQTLANSDFFHTQWCVNGCMSKALLQKSQDFFYTSPAFAKLPPTTVDQWADFTFVQKALQKLGTASGSDPVA